MKITRIYLYANTYQFAAREGLWSLEEAKEIAKEIILANNRPNFTKTLWSVFLDENLDELFNERLKFNVTEQIWK